jgi:hypothetical protein
MSNMGSLPELQEFFRTGAKPLCRFRHHAAGRLMTEFGWIADVATLIAGR